MVYIVFNRMITRTFTDRTKAIEYFLSQEDGNTFFQEKRLNN